MPFLCRWGMLPVQLVETAAALTWSYLAMPSSNLDTMVPVVNVRGPPPAPRPAFVSCMRPAIVERSCRSARQQKPLERNCAKRGNRDSSS